MMKYKDKNGIELSYTGNDSHQLLVKEVISEVINMCEGCDKNNDMSMRIALGTIKDFLKVNFDIHGEK